MNKQLPHARVWPLAYDKTRYLDGDEFPNTFRADIRCIGWVVAADSRFTSMRTITYRTSWTYLGPSGKHTQSLTDFVLDILYLMEDTGVVPPLVVLNMVLRSGGTGGGMGPGTTWKPFGITEAEYAEFVQALRSLDVADARQRHPYVHFEQVIIDPELNLCTDYLDWLQRTHQKYRQNQ